MAAKKVLIDATRRRRVKEFTNRKNLLKLPKQKTGKKTISPQDLVEAKNMVAEIMKSIGEVDSWLHGDANRKIHGLFNKWGELCKHTKNAKSRKFVAECEKILEECASFRNEIVSKSESFTNKAKPEVKKIIDKAGNSEIINILLSNTLRFWNGAERPYLLSLLDKTGELEKSIRDVMRYAMSP